MNFNISDEKISQLVENEIKRYVRDRIEKTMSDGKAYWFSQQNIEILTREIINKIIDDKIDRTIVDDAAGSIIHCKDCVHWDNETKYPYCHYWDFTMNDNDFCSKGVKK